MEVTEEISAEKNVTLSKVIVLAILLQNCLNNKTPKDKCVAALVAVLKVEMNRRFCNLDSNELYAESNILDPRFKGRWFKSKEDYEKAVCNLKRKVTPIRLNSENYEFESPAFETNSASLSSIWCDFDSEFKNTTKAANTTGSVEKEIEKYLEEEFILRTADPLVCSHKERNCIRIYILTALSDYALWLHQFLANAYFQVLGKLSEKDGCY